MPRTRPWLLALAFAGAAQAQMATPDPDWKEAEAAPPPLRTERLIRIEMPESTLRFGVDPQSISIGKDGVVRYVVVALSASGAVNAFYEGIRCSTGEGRVYARHSPGQGWVPANTDWAPVQEARNSRHSLVIARNGVCIGRAPNSSAAQIVRDLGGDANWRFWNN